jgi:hypothetical protein
MKKKYRTYEKCYDFGKIHKENMNLENTAFIGCALNAGGPSFRRSTFENCTFKNIRGNGSTIYHAIFKDCIFEDIRVYNDLFCYQALFVNCKLRGKIEGSIVIGYKNDDINYRRLWTKLKKLYVERENEKLLSKTKYSFDIRELEEFDDFDFRGEKIVPYILFREDQCLILEDRELHKKLKNLFQKYKDDDDLSLFLLAPIHPSDTRMLKIISPSLKPRLNEVKDIL